MNKAFIRQLRKNHLYPYYKGLHNGASVLREKWPDIKHNAFYTTLGILGAPAIGLSLTSRQPGKAYLQFWKTLFTDPSQLLPYGLRPTNINKEKV